MEKENKELNKKKIGIVVGALLLVLALVVIFFNKTDFKNIGGNKENAEIMDKFYKYMASKDEKVIYFGGGEKSCGYCTLETPIMKQIKKDYKIEYLYIDQDKLDEESKKEILDTLNIEDNAPVVAIVKDDVVVDTKEGYTEGKEMVKYLIKNKLLEKDAVYTPEQYLTNINYSEYEELLKSSDYNIVVIGQTTCSHCISTKPVLSHIAGNYDITINYLNLTDMDSDEQSKLTDSLKNIGYEEAENLGTPLTLIIKDGKLVSKIEGENPPSYFVRAFRKAGVIE